MLTVFGVQVVPLTCVNIDPATGIPNAALGACIDTIVPLPGGATINVGAALDVRSTIARLRASASWPSSRPCSSSCSRG